MSTEKYEGMSILIRTAGAREKPCVMDLRFLDALKDAIEVISIETETFANIQIGEAGDDIIITRNSGEAMLQSLGYMYGVKLGRSVVVSDDEIIRSFYSEKYNRKMAVRRDEEDFPFIIPDSNSKKKRLTARPLYFYSPEAYAAGRREFITPAKFGQTAFPTICRALVSDMSDNDYIEFQQTDFTFSIVVREMNKLYKEKFLTGFAKMKEEMVSVKGVKARSLIRGKGPKQPEDPLENPPPKSSGKTKRRET